MVLNLQVPYAILPSITQQNNVDYDDPSTVHRSILNIAENKRYEWENMFDGLVDAWCVGSSHGWLVLLDKDGLPLLLNPSSLTRISLPPLPQAFMQPVTQSYFVEFLRKSFIAKAVVMCFNSPSDYIVVIIYGSHFKIAYRKGENWVELLDAKHSYCDIASPNTCLYALTQDGCVEGWDLGQDFPVKLLHFRPTLERGYEERKFLGEKFSTQLYLVISNEGEILMVIRYIANFVNEHGIPVDEGSLLSSEDTQTLICPYRTLHFGVYKLDFGCIEWKKISSLHDQVLFLGANESTSIHAQDFAKCQANSIYFTDDRWSEMNLDYMYGGHDWGVFNLQEQRIQHLLPVADKIDPPTIWVVPTQTSLMT